MSHVRDCPEFRLTRTDSKDPLTTCQGVTSDGRKCRRTVISAKDASMKEAITKQLSSKNVGKPEVQVEELLCWQHKNQAPLVKTKVAAVTKLRERSSIDTLIERVGLLNVNDCPNTAKANESQIKNSRSSYRPRRDREMRTEELIERQERLAAQAHRLGKGRESAVVTSPSSKKKLSTGRRLVCFITGINRDDLPELRFRRRTEHLRAASHSDSSHAMQPAQSRVQHKQSQSLPSSVPRTSLRPSMLAHTSSSSSQTQSLLSWIPTSLSPETTSKLLQKLSEPLSPSEEWGYIYIYCVTPQKTVPSADIIPLLIPHCTEASRPTTEIMHSAGISLNRVRKDNHARPTNTITLKIGRAVNVSRRLTQQCAQNLTLVRYYPYSPSSSSSSNARSPRKAPNIHRLERLVHIELGDRRFKLQDPCGGCGKRHQEYFEIEVDTEQLRMVDECVRRWVRFSELDPSR
ncbi:hypothetical protein PRK78_001905 [Emydomyces testavorans]|uniref:Bacteriophage T5 Orf172 DNA-binding domain-containing protein n=1 Tax=Emydomyces testavorans TaxID=2070801 RepID=A0AAF0DDA0_9EURO|nr:hypothetical protein PRK78_001905 [Emydomyces testavorans]